VIDETPADYKSIEQVMQAQRDLVEVVHTLRQVFGTGGPELARQARQRVRDLPVLFVAGHAPEPDRSTRRLCASTEFLAKPFGAEELLHKVRETLTNAPPKSRQ
jgi:DNA-binding response OmpR family regulator